jgi:hypothetical protein
VGFLDRRGAGVDVRSRLHGCLNSCACRAPCQVCLVRLKEGYG